jgi:hypothetical protein
MPATCCTTAPHTAMRGRRSAYCSCTVRINALSYGRSPGTECTGSRESRIAAEAALVTAIGQDATKAPYLQEDGNGTTRQQYKVLRSYMPSALFGIAPGDWVVEEALPPYATWRCGKTATHA